MTVSCTTAYWLPVSVSSSLWRTVFCMLRSSLSFRYPGRKEIPFQPWEEEHPEKKVTASQEPAEETRGTSSRIPREDPVPVPSS